MLDLKDAISLFEAGEPREAADLLEKLAAEMPGYATARVLLARSYERMNEWEPALRAWREAHQIIPNSPVVRRGLQRAARKAASRSPIEGSRTAPKGSEPSGTETPSDVAPPGDAAADEPLEPEAAAPAEAPNPAAAAQERVAGAELQDQDLDRLISELESARIVPRPDLENLPPPDLEDDIEDVVSETLARIYASQGQYEEAAHVYELLAGQQPEKTEEFEGKASEMRSRASEQE